jgi:predicted permease
MLLIALGHLLGRTGYLPPGAVAGMKKLALNIALPVVIFTSLLRLPFEPRHLAAALAVFAACGLLLLAGVGVRKLSGARNRYLPALFTSFENGMMGYGVLAVLVGQDNIYPIVLLDLGQTLFFALVFVPYMDSLNGGRRTRGQGALAFFKNPFVLASALALGLNAAGAAPAFGAVPPLSALLESLNLLAGVTTPLRCLVIGYDRKINPTRLAKPLGVSLLRAALLFCMALAMDRLVVQPLGLGPAFKTAVYTMFLLPPFFVGAALIGDAEEEARQFALNVISVHIVVFLVLFTVMQGVG